MTALSAEIFQTAPLAVVPVLIGPLQALLTVLWYVLPALVIALATALISLLRPRAMLNFVKTLWRLKLQVGVLAACAVGLVWGAGALWPSGTGGGAVAAARQGDGDWPMFRGGLTRCGAAPGAIGPTAGRINWARLKGEEWFYSSPAVVGNRVYVASAMLTAFDSRNGTGRIYCFDADTGAVAWAADPQFDTGYGSYRATFASPVVRGDALVCGEGLHYAAGARVVCLDLATGRLRWSFQTASHVECSPVVADVTVGGRSEARVFVGAGDDGYYCLDLKTGAKRWHLPGENYPDAETALAVHEGRLYAGLGNGGKALCVLDAATGAELVRVPTPYAVFSPPAIADGTLYFGMGNGDFVERGSPPAGEVWRVDLAKLNAHKSGPFAPDWKIELPGTVLGAVAVAGERVYFGSTDGHAYAADARGGEVVAKFDAHAPICASPAVADRCVYVLTEAGMLYGLDRRTMECVWEYRVGTQERCISSPAVAGGRVYVGTQEDGFVCVGEPGAARQPLWGGRLGGADVGGNPYGSPPPRLGDFRWQFPPDQEGQGTLAAVAAPPAVIGEELFVPLTTAPGPGLACLPVAGAGDRAPKPKWLYQTAGGVFVSPAVVGDRAFCVDGKPGDANRHLHCVAVQDGAPLWRTPVRPDAAGEFVAGTRDVLVCDEANAVSACDPAGRRLWTKRLPGRAAHAPAAAGALVVAAAVEPGVLVALDRPTGKELWRADLPAAPVGSPFVDKLRVYLPTAKGLEARSLLDGSPLPADLWQGAGGGVSGDFVLDRARVAYVSPKGELIVLNRADGRAARPPVPGAKAGTCPLLGQDALLYAAANGKIMKLALASAEGDASGEGGGEGRQAPQPVEWLDASWLGEPITPMVLGGANVFLGRRGWGLVCLGEAQ
ncbi:MAG TPA: PQQ-binding-like beta-propeller repeat protein [Phycisphaerae bacterium]|nr:PQQ-binding-like beta-propeller repeat protein [Phycisphaerae bacterium]